MRRRPLNDRATATKAAFQLGDIGGVLQTGQFLAEIDPLLDQ
jgi:hypothetical protein